MASAPMPVVGIVASCGLVPVWFINALWSALMAPPPVRSAAVCAATILSTPYVMDYDLVVLGVGCAFMFAEIRNSGWLPFERSALAFIWAAPFVARSLAQAAAIPLGLCSAVLLLWLALRRTPAVQLTAWPFRRSRAVSVR